MRLLSKVNPTGNALERSHSLVNSLMHVAIACRGEYLEKLSYIEMSSTIVVNSYLSTRLAGILPLLQLLVALFVCLIVAPQSEGLGTERTGNGALITNSFPVFVR